MTLLALDGGKNIGWALFDHAGGDIGRGVVLHEDFFAYDKDWGKNHFTVTMDFMGDMHVSWADHDIDRIVVEGIRHNPNIAQGGSQRWESQVEGAVRILHAVTNIPITVQPPNILPVAMTLNGYEKPLTRTGNPKHLPDEDAAWLHGRYFLIADGVLE